LRIVRGWVFGISFQRPAFSGQRGGGVFFFVVSVGLVAVGGGNLAGLQQERGAL
jgi:hypothetical protein